ncbi:MAG: ABC transporter substrate-binding protein, partial [Clostridiales bacterium]
EIPLLIWGAIRDTLTSAESYPWITRSAPTAGQENSASAAVVLDDLGYTDWFVVSDAGDYGQGNLDVFTSELAKRNLTPLGSEIVQEDATDFSAIVAKIKNSGAKAVYCGSTVEIASLLKLQLFEAGVTDILFAGISGMKTADFLKIGAEAAEGALVVSPGVDLQTTEAGLAFVDAYTTAGFSEPIGAYTPYAYEAALIMLNALSACGEAPTAALMVDAIKDSNTTGVFGTTTFDEIGQTTNVATYLNVVQDGAWVNYINSEYASGVRSFGGK